MRSKGNTCEIAQVCNNSDMHAVNIPASDVFAALSDLTRIRIVRLLTSLNEQACLCEFVDSLHEPEYKLSKHLKLLKQAGFLTTTKEGRWVYHNLVESPVLSNLYQAVKALPDSDGVFRQDLSRFKKRMGLRENGRCCVGTTQTKLSKQIP